MTQCPYYYHSWSNVPPVRCALEEDHEGEHRRMVIKAPNFQSVTSIGWKKH